MAAFGAVGRFAVAGWRVDFEITTVRVTDVLQLGEVSFLVATAATINVVPSDLVLVEVAYQPSAGVVFDYVLPDALVIADVAYGAEGGDSAPYGLPDPLVLEEVAFDVPAGNVVDYILPDPIVLDEVSYSPRSGAAGDYVPPDALVLGEIAYQAGSGTISTFVPADALVLGELTSEARAGASVQVRADRRFFYVSTVAGWAVAGGPAARIARHLRASAPAYDVLAGATIDTDLEDLGLAEVAYEVGARRKPVRGQMWIY